MSVKACTKGTFIDILIRRCFSDVGLIFDCNHPLYTSLRIRWNNRFIKDELYNFVHSDFPEVIFDDFKTIYEYYKKYISHEVKNANIKESN